MSNSTDSLSLYSISPPESRDPGRILVNLPDFPDLVISTDTEITIMSLSDLEEDLPNSPIPFSSRSENDLEINVNIERLTNVTVSSESENPVVDLSYTGLVENVINREQPEDELFDKDYYHLYFEEPSGDGRLSRESSFSGDFDSNSSTFSNSRGLEDDEVTTGTETPLNIENLSFSPLVLSESSSIMAVENEFFEDIYFEPHAGDVEKQNSRESCKINLNIRCVKDRDQISTATDFIKILMANDVKTWQMMSRHGRTRRCHLPFYKILSEILNY